MKKLFKGLGIRMILDNLVSNDIIINWMGYVIEIKAFKEREKK